MPGTSLQLGFFHKTDAHRRRHRRPILEALEDRALLSNIEWINRGNDGFAIFNNLPVITPGVSNAEVARNVVDAAIVSWERVIDDFNQLQEIGQPERNRIDLTLSINPGGVGNGGVTNQFLNDGILHPIAGSILIGRGADLGIGNPTVGDGGGWFLDPTPLDNSEFLGTIANAFVGLAPASSPAFNQVDLYSVVIHELTHLVGIHPNSILLQDPDAGTVTNTGLADDALGGGVGRYFVFDGPSVTHLMTSNNGGPTGADLGVITHSAGPGGTSQPINFNSAFRGNRQLVGAVDHVNSTGIVSARTLISEAMTLVLQDAYSYSVVPPQRFGTFYATLHDDGELLIRGAATNNGSGLADNSNDLVTLRREGADLVVSVDVGVDVPGTNRNGDSSNAPAWVSRFPFNEIDFITLRTGAGSDEVTLDFSGGDLIPSGGISYDGGSGGNELNQIRAVGNVSYFLTANALQVGSFGSVALNNFVQYAILEGGPSANTLSVNGWTRPVELRGAGSGDNYQITLSAGNSGTYFVDESAGDLGFDDLTINGTAAADNLTLRGDEVVRGTQVVTYTAGVDQLQINTLDGSDTITVESTDASLIVNGGFQDDTVTLNYTVSFFGIVRSIPRSVPIADAAGTNDTLNVNVSTATTENFALTSADLTGNALGGDGLDYASIERLNVSLNAVGHNVDVLSTSATTTTTVNSGNGSDSIHVIATSSPLIINAGRGSDTIRLGGITVNGIRGPITIDAGTNPAAEPDNLILQESEPPGLTNVGCLGTPVSAGPGRGFLGGFGMGGANDNVNFFNTENAIILEGPSNDFVLFQFSSAPLFNIGLVLDGGNDGVVFAGTDRSDRINISRRVGPDGPEIVASINDQTFVAGYQGGDTVRVLGGRGHDRITVDASVTTWRTELFGEDGHDRLEGGPLADLLDGGDGHDELFGGDGDDELIGGPGQDLFDGGGGADRIRAQDRQRDLIYADVADLLIDLDDRDQVLRRRRPKS